MFRRTRALPAGMVLLAAAALTAGCSGGGAASPGGSGSGAPVTIKAVLPPNTGPITAADNVGLKDLTQQYQAAHKSVTVQWLPNNFSSITQSNAQLESQASGSSAPDVASRATRPGSNGWRPRRCWPARSASSTSTTAR
jgi:ABC-type glycerol-3-phosphate transport system substrate-binding protein